MRLELIFEFYLFLKNVVEENIKVLYFLYGVVEYSGIMRLGYYIVYVKVRIVNSYFFNFVFYGDIL